MRVLPRNESVFEAEIAEEYVTNVAELRSFDKRNGGPFSQKRPKVSETYHSAFAAA